MVRLHLRILGNLQLEQTYMALKLHLGRCSVV